jgi:putative inorganic carbon (hco3(-)) transporter
MLRTLLVIAALVVGWRLALQRPIYAAAFYLWIAYFRPESWAWDDMFVTMNLSYIAGAYLVGRTVLSSTPFRLDFRTVLMLLFLGQALLATMFAPDFDYSFSYWYAFAKAIIVSYLLTVLITNAADLRLILMVIVFSLGFEATKQGWAQLVLNPGAPNTNSVPFLGDNNLVAVGMAMLLPVVAALGLTSTGWRRRLFQFMSIGVFYRAVSTYSRGGFLAVGAVSAIYFWRSPHKLRTVLAFALATAIVVPVLPQQFWDRMATITAPAEQRDESQEGRLHFWRVAVAMANDRPFVGVGHSGYPRVYNQYDWSDGLFLTNRAVHSAWFGVLAELGYPGFLLFVAIVFSSVRGCRRVRQWAKQGEVSAPLGAYAVALESAMVAFIVGGSFVSFHYCEMLWHFFALTIALENVAVKEVAAAREAAALQARSAAPAASPVAPRTPAPEPEFVWG